MKKLKGLRSPFSFLPFNNNFRFRKFRLFVNEQLGAQPSFRLSRFEYAVVFRGHKDTKNDRSSLTVILVVRNFPEY